MITAEFSALVNSEIKITLVNILGEVILSEQLHVTQEVEKFALDVSSINNGVYYVIAESDNFKEVRKIVVTH
jgi:hypothetical protein